MVKMGKVTASHWIDTNNPYQMRKNHWTSFHISIENGARTEHGVLFATLSTGATKSMITLYSLDVESLEEIIYRAKLALEALKTASMALRWCLTEGERR